ncbi:MAG: YihA family ribosome biogenesis GTP-binding protein [Prevotellaceae bacterium]|jgi:ribosome biogenesis GTP-binding protein ysxC|nr:YihA family ribosome biogenesis GTP-binding protein [Prevotellaceae bacterium]
MLIKTAEFVISSARADRCPPTDGKPEYAFIGRSNVGKSSLINMLTGRKKLAMTSATPGKTLLINHFSINNEWYLVDLPGYGYAKRGKKEMEKLRNLIEYYVLERKELTCLFVLIDSRLTPQRIDLEFIQWLGEEGVPFALIFTKADKSKTTELRKNVDGFLNELRKEWEELPPHFVTSSAQGRGRDEVLDYIEQINTQFHENA